MLFIYVCMLPRIKHLVLTVLYHYESSQRRLLAQSLHVLRLHDDIGLGSLIENCGSYVNDLATCRSNFWTNIKA